MVTSAAAVLRVLRALHVRGCRVWVAGGWGVDALVGHETRHHRDVDLLVDSGTYRAAVAHLVGLGHRVTVEVPPTRVELAGPDGDVVDLHPLVMETSGAAFVPLPDGTRFPYPPESRTVGVIDGCPVPCVSVAQQLLLHSGYALRDEDAHDLDHLRRLAQLDVTTSVGDRHPAPSLPGEDASAQGSNLDLK